MSAPTATVAICAYTEDRWSDLVAAVHSVATQQPAQLIVVIDHNESLFRRAESELDGVEVYRSGGPRGLSGARNTAIELATGDVVAFLDDDAIAASGWLAGLLTHFDDPLVLGVGGWAEPAWDSPRPAWFADEFLWVVGCSHRGLPTAVSAVRNLIGCNMAIRAELLRKVGGFDVGLGRTADRPLGCEETELCIRAVELVPGGRFLLEPAAVVTHRVPAGRATWRYFLARCRAEGASKAWVADRVGAASATATERRYVTRTLPAALGRDLVDIARGDVGGFGRMAAVLAGLATTSAAYARHRLSAGRSRPVVADRDDGPLATFVIDRAEELPALERSVAPDGTPYDGAHCFVLDGRHPVGVVVVGFDDEVISPTALATAVGALPAADHPSDCAVGDPESITVVVATRDRPALLERCIRSVFAGSVRPANLVVVDNAPSDNTTAAQVDALAAEFPALQYVRDDRPGLAIAHNSGLSQVVTPLVAFTDDDVVVGHHWLESVIATFAGDAAIACVTGAIVPLELDTPTQRTIEEISGFSKGWQADTFHRDDRHRGPLFPYAAGVFGSGANMSFRTADLRQLGGFDDALGAGSRSRGGDDLAAFFDVIDSGRYLRYEPAAFVRHQHHRDADALPRQAYGYGAGLTAHLTRCVLRRPRAAIHFVRAGAAGVRRAAAISAPEQTSSKVALRGATIRGMSTGPFRYAIARRSARRFAASTKP